MHRNYKVVRLYKYFMLLAAFIFSFVSLGFSSWSPFDAFNVESVNIDPVCYNSSTGIQYYTIEDALNNATSGQTINTYVGKNPTIRKNVTIKSGVTLTLAFDDSGNWNGRQSGSDTSKWFDDGGINFADGTSASVTKYRKNSVKIAKNVTLTNNGTINIAGVLGAESNGLSGHTSGNYAEFVLSSNAKIISKGTINCLGYIKEDAIDNGSQLIVESGTVNAPFIIYDYRGGSSTAGSYKNGGITPFNVFDMPNIKVFSKYTYNSRLVGYADLHTGTVAAGGITLLDAQHNTTDINIIGNSSSTITLTSQSSYVLAKYNYSSLLYTEKSNYSVFTDIKIYGGASSGVMKLTVKLPALLGGNTTVSTDNCFFPINYRIHLSLFDGSYKFINPMKVLTGGEIYVAQNASLSVNSDLIIYPDTFSDTAYGGSQYPTSLPAGKFTVDGQVTYANAIGGLTETTSNKTDFAYIYENTATTTVTSSEGYATRDGLSFVYNETSRITEQATAYINSAGTISEQNLSQTVYVSEKNTNYFIEASNLGSYTIKYHLNGGSVENETVTDDVVTKSYPIMKGISLQLNSFTIDTPKKRFYQFNEWKLVSETGNSALGSVVSDGTTLDVYASYDIASYKINYLVAYKDDAEMSENYNNDNPDTFTVNDLPITLKDPTDGSLSFYGWYYDNDTTTEITTLSSSSSFIGYGDISLAGYFSNKRMAKVTFNANGHADYFDNLSSFNIITSDPKEIKLPSSKYDNDENKEFYITSWKDQAGNIFDANTYVFTADEIVLSPQWSSKIVANYYNNPYGNSNNSVVSTKYYYPGAKVTLEDSSISANQTIYENTNENDSSFYNICKASKWYYPNQNKAYDIGIPVALSVTEPGSIMNLYPYEFNTIITTYYKITFINEARYQQSETTPLSYSYSLDNVNFEQVPNAKFNKKYAWSEVTMASSGKTWLYIEKDTTVYVKVKKSYSSSVFGSYNSTLTYPGGSSTGTDERTVIFTVSSAATVTLKN